MNIRISTLALALAVGASFATDPRLEQGNAYAAQGEYDKAIAEYRAVLAEQPRNSEAYFAAGEARMKKKDYSGAIANYRLAYKYEPTMSAAYEGAAKVYEALGQKGKAEAERAKDPKNKPVEEVAQEAAPVAAETAPAMMPIEAGTTAPTETATAPAEPATAAPATSPEPTAPVVQSPAEAAPATETAAAPAQVPAETAPVATAPVAESAKPVAEAPAVPATETAPVQPAAEKVATAEPQTAPAAEPAPAQPTAESAAVLPEDPFEKGKVLLSQGKFKEAAPLWREVLSKHPGHAGAYFYAGVTRYELGEMDKAEFNLKKGLTYKEEGNDANFYLACVYQKTKKEEQEKKALAAYLKKAAPNAKFRKQAEERFAALTKPQESVATTVPEETTQAAAAATPTTAPAAPAAIAESENAATAATVANATASTTGPTDIPSVANANNLFKAGDLEGALQMYRTLLEKEISPDERYFSMLQMGNIYREMRDFHSAVTRYREVVQQFPDSDWAMEAERAMEDAVWLEKHASELPRRAR